jgi:hypothetical protein
MDWIQIQHKDALFVQQIIMNAFVQSLAYLLVPYMTAEFQQDRLNQMLNGFLQFSYKEAQNGASPNKLVQRGNKITL